MYKVTQSLQQSLPGYSCPAGNGVFTVITSPRTTMCNAVLPCDAASVMSCHTELRRATRYKE